MMTVNRKIHLQHAQFKSTSYKNRLLGQHINLTTLILSINLIHPYKKGLLLSQVQGREELRYFKEEMVDHIHSEKLKCQVFTNKLWEMQVKL